MKKGYSREVEAFPFFDRDTQSLSVLKALARPSIIKRHFHPHHLKIELLFLHIGGHNAH